MSGRAWIPLGRARKSGRRRFPRIPFPIADFRHVLAVFADVALVCSISLSRIVCVRSRQRARPELGTRSMTSITRWKRSRSFSTVMSKGVVVVPSSL